MRFKNTIFLFILFIFLGCREMPSNKPPIHLNPNMDNQERFDAQERQYFYNSDTLSKRTPIIGTIPLGYLKEDILFNFGKDENDDYVNKVSDVMDVDVSFIERGRDRYNIYCSVCHGYTGDGDGLVSQNKEYTLIPTSIHSSTLDDKTDGYLFNIISNGSLNKNMPSYSAQIPTEDRWAIVSYLRALRLTREKD